MSYILREAQTLEELANVVKLRTQIFCQEQGFTHDSIHYGSDENCTILLIIYKEKIVGAARIRYINNAAKFESITIEKEHRGKGCGNMFLEKMKEIAISKGYSLLKITGQSRLNSYYSKHGFHVVGEAFDIDGIRHNFFELHVA